MVNHPIEGLMVTAMNSIEKMIDVNTIIGDPIELPNNIVVIPVSKVCFGFAAGGSEFRGKAVDEYNKRNREEKEEYRFPFGGGSGATVNVNPVAFIVVENEKVKLLPVSHSSSLDKIIDYIPELLGKISTKKENEENKDNYNISKISKKIKLGNKENEIEKVEIKKIEDE